MVRELESWVSDGFQALRWPRVERLIQNQKMFQLPKRRGQEGVLRLGGERQGEGR